MASPYIHTPTAIVAGTPQRRHIGQAFPNARRDFVRELGMYNRSPSLTFTVRPNGLDPITVGPDSFVPHSKEGQEIKFYTVDVDQAGHAGTEFDVYEYGGVHDEG